MGDNDKLFDKIYLDTKDDIYKFICVKCRSINDCDDIFQDTYVALYEYLCRHGKPIENPIALVRTICKRRLIKHYIFYSKGRAEIVSEESFESDDEELLKRINKLLEKKSAYIRKIFFMRHSLDMSFSEIAAALGKSEGAVKAQYYKAIADIRRRFEREEEK